MKQIIVFALGAFLAFNSCSDKPEVLPPGNTLIVYPNPLFNHATISIQNPEGNPFHLVAFDAKGRVLLERRESLGEASYSILHEEPKGTYQVVLEIDGMTFTRKIIKL